MSNPVLLENGVQNAVVRRSILRNYNICEVDAHLGNSPSPAVANCGNPGWPGGLAVVRSPNALVLVEDNDVHDGYGEGSNCNQSSLCVFRGNRYWEHRSNANYADGGGGMISEYNVSYYHWGDVSGYTFALTPTHGGGYVSGSEDSQGAPDFDYVSIVRNNINIGSDVGLRFAMESGNEAAGYQIGMAGYGNTMVATQSHALSFNDINNGNVLAGSEFIQNLAYQPGASSSCTAPSDPTITDNFMTPAAADADCVDAGNGTGDPLFPRAYATFDQATGANNPVDPASDLCLGAGSPAIGVGDTVLTTQNAPLLTTLRAQGSWLLSQFRIKVPASWDDWEKKLKLDYNGDVRTQVFAGAVPPC